MAPLSDGAGPLDCVAVVVNHSSHVGMSNPMMAVEFSSGVSDV